LFFQSKLSIQLWEECVSIATILINRIPSSILQLKSLYHVLYDTKPDYHSLKTFGCLANVTTFPSFSNKFTHRVIPSIFVGYPRGYKGHKLYNLYTKWFFISRDVLFHETIFPYKKWFLLEVNDMVIPLPNIDNLP